MEVKARFQPDASGVSSVGENLTLDFNMCRKASQHSGGNANTQYNIPQYTSLGLSSSITVWCIFKEG